MRVFTANKHGHLEMDPLESPSLFVERRHADPVVQEILCGAHWYPSFSTHNGTQFKGKSLLETSKTVNQFVSCVYI
jgi:hypothetical protein